MSGRLTDTRWTYSTAVISTVASTSLIAWNVLFLIIGHRFFFATIQGLKSAVLSGILSTGTFGN